MNKRIELINTMISDNTLDNENKLSLLNKWNNQVNDEIMEQPRHSSELKPYTDTLKHIEICIEQINSQ